MENISVTGIDLAKSVYSACCVNHVGRVVKRRSLNRTQLLPFLRSLPKGSIVAMEACGGAHHLGWQCKELGLEPRIISPQFVVPYRRAQKNDTNDAEAICEAARAPTMRFVSLKSQDKLEIQMVHRVRERLLKNRTAVINQMRGFLTEVGITLPKGAGQFEKKMRIVLAELEQNSPRLFTLMSSLWSELIAINDRLEGMTCEVEKIAATHPLCKEVRKLRGIGPISASAVVAAIGNPRDYKNGRNFAASLGLVPRQFSTGGRTKLGSITKSGDGYLRKLLVHGARAVVSQTVRKKRHTPLDLWILRLYNQYGTNHTAVALANKNARHVWAILNATVNGTNQIQ